MTHAWRYIRTFWPPKNHHWEASKRSRDDNFCPKNVCFVYEAPSANFRGVRWSKHSPLDASCHVQSPFQLCLTYFGLLKLLMAQYGSWLFLGAKASFFWDTLYHIFRESMLAWHSFRHVRQSLTGCMTRAQVLLGYSGVTPSGASYLTPTSWQL